ncbi:hypothetical protein [Paraglaciecola sp.]|uniref:hypothetical protein n=1 Tax=Paraglaciecola sp. TaxID=1920173 RepID=UPI003EF83E36
MDLNQRTLKSLMKKTDRMFESYKLHPTSDDHARAYEQAKTELDNFLAAMRKSTHISK